MHDAARRHLMWGTRVMARQGGGILQSPYPKQRVLGMLMLQDHEKNTSKQKDLTLTALL